MADVHVIVPYDPRWPQDYAAERARIAAAFGPHAVRIDHNGSTSVPGLAAKPVIDIQVSVERLYPVDAYAPHLVALGYVHVPHADDAFSSFFHRPAVWPHTHHVHVVQAGGDEERRTLAFRDYLREHDDVASEYVDLKRSLAPRHATATFAERQAYADAKGPFVRGVVERALAAGYPRALSTTIREGHAADVDAVLALLRDCRLPVDGVPDELESFVVATLGERIVGVAGLELHGRDGLVRSVAVAADVRGGKLGSRLCAEIERRAARVGADRLFLLTETAERFFVTRGYAVVDRARAPVGIAASREFSAVCPASAVLMARESSVRSEFPAPIAVGRE